MGMELSLKEIDRILEEPPEVPASVKKRGFALFKGKSEEQKLREKEIFLSKKESELSGREFLLSHIKVDLKEKEEELLQKESEFKQRENKIEEIKSQLVKKESEIAVKDDILKKEVQRLADKDRLLMDKEKDLTSKITSRDGNLSKQKSELEREIGALKQEKEGILKQAEYDKKRLAELKGTFNKNKEALSMSYQRKQAEKEKEILEEIEELEQSKERMAKRERDIKQREIKIEEIKNQLVKKESEIAIKDDILKKEVQRLADKDRLLMDKEKDLTSKIASRDGYQDKKILEEKEEEILKEIERLKENKKLVVKKEKEIVRKVREMEGNKQILMKEEAKVVRHLKELKEKHNKFKEEFIALIEAKKTVELKLKERETKLGCLNKEWRDKEVLFNRNIGFLSESTKVIGNMSYDIQNKLELFSKEEKNATKHIEMLEKDKSLFERKEIELPNKINNLVKREHLIISKEKEVSKREDIIRKAKELKENIPKLEIEHNIIKRKLEGEKERLNKLTEEAVAKWEMVKSKELEVMKRERASIKKMAELKRKQEELIDESKILKEEELQMYIEKELNMPSVRFEAEEEEYKKHPEIIPLMNKAKEFINSKNIEEALRIIKELEVLHKNLKDEDEDKRKINYDLMELKTDVKLATLS